MNVRDIAVTSQGHDSVSMLVNVSRRSLSAEAEQIIEGEGEAVPVLN
jgi:hypothetical protein